MKKYTLIKGKYHQLGEDGTLMCKVAGDVIELNEAQAVAFKDMIKPYVKPEVKKETSKPETKPQVKK
jgi:hypothetical protein